VCILSNGYIGDEVAVQVYRLIVASPSLQMTNLPENGMVTSRDPF